MTDSVLLLAKPCRAMTRVRSLLRMLLLMLVLVVPSTVAQDATLAPLTGTGSGFLEVRVPDSNVVDAAMAELALLDALRQVFPTTNVRCVDMSDETTTTTTLATADIFQEPRANFLILFFVGENATASPTLSVDVVRLRDVLQLRLAPTSAPITLRILATNPGPLAALNAITPLANTSFLRVDMNFRNLLSVANLTQSLIYQTRRGIANFLALPASTRAVLPAGPPQVPPATVLLVAQSFFVLLPESPPATLEYRERLANLLIYGDPARLVTTTTSSPRPAMFLDFVSSTWTTIEPTVLLTLPYVYASVVVDPFPMGNPPAPLPPAETGTPIPATPTSELLARARKTQRFLWTSSPPPRDTGLTYPTIPVNLTSPDPSSTTCPTGFCTHVYWRNSLDTALWVESLASVERVAWNLFPSTPLCASTSTPGSLLTSPIVAVGNGSDTPVWTFTALSGTATRLDFALQLRSLDDNATALTVEIATDIRSPLEAASTVTSIARRRAVPDSTGATVPPPIYMTKSNVIVTYTSHFRNANEVLLFLDVRLSEVTQRDTSQPCAHCQNVYSWCQTHTRCSEMLNCLLRDGLESAQVPATLLQSPTLQDVMDVSPYFRTCLSTTSTASTTSTDLDAILLLSSAVRCQLQRMCAFRTPAFYGLSGLDDRILLWESGDGRQVVQMPAGTLPKTPETALNVTLRLGAKPLCSLAISTATTAQSLEDTIARQCRYANYLGRVGVTVSLNATSLDQIEFRFRHLVGPMPTLDVVSPLASVLITALPTLRLRLETIDFATALPAVPPPLPVDVCSTKCRPLALDTCLRDLTCVAFTDCITRTELTPGSALGDAILDLFERQAVGETLALTPAITRCHAQEHVNQRAWRSLVAASACYAKHDCPLSLALLVPTATNVVAKWRVTPATQTQRLVFTQLDTTATTSSIPLVIKDAQGQVLATATSSFDPLDLQTKLRVLLAYDDVTVRLDSDSGSDTTRVVQWTIEYAFWIGLLPRFIDDSSPLWTLATMPSTTSSSTPTTYDPPQYVLEMVLAANDSTTNTTTTSFVELPAP